MENKEYQNKQKLQEPEILSPKSVNEKVAGDKYLKNKDGVIGPVIGSVIVIILIVLGGIYYWNTIVSKEMQENPIETQESSLEEIEASIDADLSELDSELNIELDQIEAEFNNETSI